MSTPRVVLICLVVALAAPSFAQERDVARDIVADNATLSAQIDNEAKALDRAMVELADLRKAKHDLDERVQWLERRAEVYALGQEFAQTLTEQLRELPRAERFALASEQRAEELAAASDASLRVERALGELDDLDAATAKRLAAALPPALREQRTQVEPAVLALLTQQRDLLERLTALQRRKLEVMQEAQGVGRDVQRQSEEARAELTRFLFWIPAPPSTKTVSGIGPALAWTTSATNWRTAGDVLREKLARRPFWLVAPMLAAMVLLALRGRLLRGLASLSPAAVSYERYRIGHSLAALAITLALALPFPIVFWTLAVTLAAAPDGQPFALALGAASLAIAKLLLAISTVAWLLDRRGVAIHHFGWDEISLGGVARGLRRFAVIFVPLTFIAALNGLDHAPFANREGLARLAFGLAMITLVAFLARLLSRGSPLVQRLRFRAPRSAAAQLHAVWFCALLAIPLAVAALAAAGYFVAAGYFFGKILDSVFLAIGAVMLYGLMALWVQVQRAQLARRREEQAARTKDAAPAVEAGGEVAEPRPARLDIDTLGEQTKSLLDLFVTLLLLAGLWLVWQEAVPVLSVIGDYSLWSYGEVVDGKQVTHPLTIGHLLLATIVGIVTGVVVRNVGALLDIVLLQRLEMQKDTTYAIKVIARYVVTVVGVLLACSILGIRWNDVQWLVAALGVGLGFGLQEIVANFVSGLIVLAERPIRIGDVVTVGNVSGTVSSIHARATVVVDFDNKEVIIPNKAFITERVVNWTLSNQTTRMLIKIGVAYGSDIAQVQRVIIAAVRRIRDVLADPAPSVYLVAFGDSTLDFEIRVFVDSFDKRLRVQHEINVEVERSLRESGIEMPFPQHDLHIRTASGIAEALRIDHGGLDRDRGSGAANPESSP